MGIIENPICVICNREEETAKHMLLLCEWTRGCWFERCHGMGIERAKVSSFDRWLVEIVKEVKGKDMRNVLNDVASVCWYIWKGRCEVTMEE